MDRYSMNEFKPLTLMDKKLLVEQEINDLSDELAPMGASISDICSQLSFLNSDIRGKRLPDEEYRFKQGQQNQLIKEKARIEKKIVDLKPKLRKLHLEKEKLENDLKRTPATDLKLSVIEIRDKYMAFASDTTRVSSMRAMASKFVEELQALIKNM